MTTDLRENDVIYGGEEKLHQALLEIAEKHQPKAIFVYNTCVSSLIGENLDIVCHQAQTALSIPVIPVNAPGFLGDKNIGNRIAGDILLKYVIGQELDPGIPYAKNPHAINLIGEYNIAGDLWGVLPEFKNLGIILQTAITGDAKFDDLRSAHRASLNVLVCSKSLTNLARQMELRWEIPFIDASFYGVKETSNALVNIAMALGDPDLLRRTRQYVKEREIFTRAKLVPYKEKLAGKTAILFTGGIKTWSMVSTLKELGIQVLAGGTQNSTPEDFLRMKAMMDPAAHIIEDTSADGFLRLIKDKKPDLIVAGGKTKYLAYKTRTPFLDINHGRKLPYAGYQGMITFAQALTRTVFSPVWDLLGQPFAGEGGSSDE